VTGTQEAAKNFGQVIRLGFDSEIFLIVHKHRRATSVLNPDLHEVAASAVIHRALIGLG
jgi:hypothetical protein